MYLDKVINIIDKRYIVEIRGDLFKYIYELVKLFKKLSNRSRVHLLIYSNCKYIDINAFYHEIEPYLKQMSNITVFWEYDIEALIYHTVLLENTDKSYLVIILPYISEYVSQIENTYMYKLKKILSNEVLNKGWRVLIINPVKNIVKTNYFYKTTIGDIVLSIKSVDRIIKKQIVLENIYR